MEFYSQLAGSASLYADAQLALTAVAHMDANSSFCTVVLARNCTSLPPRELLT